MPNSKLGSARKLLRQANQRTENEVYAHSVVFHVLFRSGNASENISAAQIQSQLDVLNEDFGRYNPDTNNTRSPFGQWQPIRVSSFVWRNAPRRDYLRQGLTALNIHRGPLLAKVSSTIQLNLPPFGT